MTGFGRSEGIVDGISWSWELRAVNGKGLDIRLRLPNGFEKIEPQVRKLISRKVSRGNLQAVVNIDRPKAAQLPSLNTDVLENVLTAIDEIEKRSQRVSSSAAEILAIRGVFDVSQENADPGTQTRLQSELLSGLDRCLDALNENRAGEGAALGNLLLDQLSQIEVFAEQAEADKSRTPKAILERLNAQLERLTTSDNGLDNERLHQEAALLATKADIREELDRLTTHVASARALIGEGSPVGRKLEFLAQEFNRESNTLCSKSNAVSLTAIGLELKVVIDQFREQILNIE